MSNPVQLGHDPAGCSDLPSRQQLTLGLAKVFDSLVGRKTRLDRDPHRDRVTHSLTQQYIFLIMEITLWAACVE